MGADITFYKGKEEWYFRDAYNSANLSWVVGLSYWEALKQMEKYPNMELCLAKSFFINLSNITDEQIHKYVEDKELDEDYEKVLIEKRDEIRRNIKFIVESDKVDWSV